MSSLDPHLVAAARRSVKLALLEPIEPLLAVYGAGVESSAYRDPNGALVKCRQFAVATALEARVAERAAAGAG